MKSNIIALKKDNKLGIESDNNLKNDARDFDKNKEKADSKMEAALEGKKQNSDEMEVALEGKEQNSDGIEVALEGKEQNSDEMEAVLEKKEQNPNEIKNDVENENKLINQQILEEKKTENNKLRENIEAESIKIQEARWIEEEIKKQRAFEDELREKLHREQELLFERKKGIEENINRTRELKRYNEDHKLDLENQVYGLYDISLDRLEGIKQYKRAIFKGIATVEFIFSLFLAIFTIAAFGDRSWISMFMCMAVAVQAALIPREHEYSELSDFICKILYILIFPIMVGIFAIEMSGIKFLDAYIPYVSYGLLACAVIGSLSYFLFNPNSKYRSGIRLARKDLKNLRQDAKRQVIKNRKNREKEEKLRRREEERQLKREEKNK